MRQLDALGEIPEHLIGIYDIVHLQLFQVVVKNNDPGPLLQNMLRILSRYPNLLACKHTLAFIRTLHCSYPTHSSVLSLIRSMLGQKLHDLSPHHVN